MTFATMQAEFRALNTELSGLALDGTYRHMAWLPTIEEKDKYEAMENVGVTFPDIEDLKMDVARKYTRLQPTASDRQAVRAVFFIDPKAKFPTLLDQPRSKREKPRRLLVPIQTSDA